MFQAQLPLPLVPSFCLVPGVVRGALNRHCTVDHSGPGPHGCGQGSLRMYHPASACLPQGGSRSVIPLVDCRRCVDADGPGRHNS